MREILFRGKTGLLDGSITWVNGSLITYPHNGKMEISTYKGYSAMAGSHMVEVREIYPETVGQYTGLEDKNGAKIFEGDIVIAKQGREQDRAVITFENGAFIVQPATDKILEKTLWEYWWNDWDLEVIGNIHDNPELLEATP